MRGSVIFQHGVGLAMPSQTRRPSEVEATKTKNVAVRHIKFLPYSGWKKGEGRGVREISNGLKVFVLFVDAIPRVGSREGLQWCNGTLVTRPSPESYISTCLN